MTRKPLPPFALDATLQLMPAGNGGWVIHAQSGRHPYEAATPLGAFTNAADMLAALTDALDHPEPEVALTDYFARTVKGVSE